MNTSVKQALGGSIEHTQPHLAGEVLPCLGQRLGGQEGGGPHRAGQEGVGPLELVTDAEVCDLDVSVLPHQQVGRLHVSVDDLLVVHCHAITHKLKLWTNHVSAKPAANSRSGDRQQSG